MSKTEQTLIYITNENVEEAKFMSRSFVNTRVKTRAYINALCSEVIKNYLQSEGIDVDNLHNLHSISKVLENNDIADILLPNIHIDVRAVFEEDLIFVPKSHFEKGIEPDVYAVVKMDENYNSAEFLGYFQTDVIDEDNSNKDYYFVTKKQLISPSTFKNFVKDFVGKAPRYLTEDDVLRGKELALGMNDNNISSLEEKELLELLLLSDSLRESVLEFDNFEKLAYSASSQVVNLIQNAVPIAGENLTATDEEEGFEGFGDFDLSDTSQEMSVDDLLDRTIAAIDEDKETKPDSTAGDVLSTLGKAAAGTAAMAAGAAFAAGASQAAGAAEVVETGLDAAKQAAEVSEEAIKLASVSGDITHDSDVVPELDSSDDFDIQEPELSLDDEAVEENSVEQKLTGEDEFEAVKDLSEMDKVGTIASEEKEQYFEPETVNMHEMESVENEVIEEDVDSLSDIDNLEVPETLTNEDEFLEVHGISESEVVDLPMTDFSINEDGTSSIDAINLEMETQEPEELLEMPSLSAAADELNIEDDLSLELNEEKIEQPEISDEIAAETTVPELESEQQDIIDEKLSADDDIENLNEDIIQFDADEEHSTEDVIPSDADEELSNEDVIPSDADEEHSNEEIQDSAYEVEDLENLADKGILQAAVPEHEPVGYESADLSDFVDFEDFKPQNSEVSDDVDDVQKTVDIAQVSENSTLISSENPIVGEIPIDVNTPIESGFDATPLGELYNPSSEIPSETIVDTPGTIGKKVPNSKTSMTGIFGAIIALLIVGVIGFFVSKMINAPKNEAPQPITDESVPSAVDNGAGNSNTLNVDNKNVVNMNKNTNALASTAGSSVAEARKSGHATAFVDIKRLTWEVPDYVSYDANFKQYFQSVGKSLKLALVSDLLLATDYIYSSPVKVSVTFSKEGDFKNSQVINSSGSTQIDSIVLQTVNQTLKSLKAPHSIGKDESTTAILKIYF